MPTGADFSLFSMQAGDTKGRLQKQKSKLQIGDWVCTVTQTTAVAAGKVECSSFSFFSSEHGSDRRTVQEYLQSKSASQIDDVLDVVIETGVFKVT